MTLRFTAPVIGLALVCVLARSALAAKVRARIPAFVDRHFGIRGALKLNRKGLGRDLYRAPLNAALILPLYYVADTTLTLARRTLNGEPFWQAHRTHFYQRATDHGFTVPEIITRVFAVNLVLVALAVWTVLTPTFPVALAAFGAALLIVGWLLLTFMRGKT